jgi:hypothetical protein
MSRIVVLSLAVVALLFALPASAAPTPPSGAAAAATACPQPVALFDIVTPEPESAVALPDWLDNPTAASTAVVYHGYCACECSTIKDCNTNADCSNHRCSRAISCC